MILQMNMADFNSDVYETKNHIKIKFKSVETTSDIEKSEGKCIVVFRTKNIYTYVYILFILF